MTWIMAAIDLVKERRSLGDAHRFYVAMMPLGTGNDLARTFGWGGKFRSACLQPAWVDAAKKAKPVPLDRWLVSVMPSAEGQTSEKLLDVPEVFSVHEFEATAEAGAPKSRHTTLKEGRHHSVRLTETSVANLVQHDAEMRKPDAGGARLESDAFEGAVAERHSFEDRGEATKALMQAHVKPSESVLKLGGSWRSYDGTFSNYFSLGVDAAGAHAFHSARRANPSRFSSPLKNQALYAWLGACATGGLCGCKGPPPKLAEVSKLLARVDGENGWREVPVPGGCRGLIVLNLQSYAGVAICGGPNRPAATRRSAARRPRTSRTRPRRRRATTACSRSWWPTMCSPRRDARRDERPRGAREAPHPRQGAADHDAGARLHADRRRALAPAAGDGPPQVLRPVDGPQARELRRYVKHTRFELCRGAPPGPRGARAGLTRPRGGRRPAARRPTASRARGRRGSSAC